MRVTSVSFAFINQLNRQKSSIRFRQNTAVICLLSLMPTSYALLNPHSCIVQDADGTDHFYTLLVPIKNQFRQYLLKLYNTQQIIKKLFSFSLKFTSGNLLLAVVAFLWTKFMWCKRESAHYLLRPNQLSLKFLLQPQEVFE